MFEAELEGANHGHLCLLECPPAADGAGDLDFLLDCLRKVLEELGKHEVARSLLGKGEVPLLPRLLLTVNAIA